MRGEHDQEYALSGAESTGKSGHERTMEAGFAGRRGGLVGGVPGERFVEGVEQDDDDDPKDNAGGNTVFAGNFFVEVFVFQWGVSTW